MIKLGTLRCGDYPALSRQTQPNLYLSWWGLERKVTMADGQGDIMLPPVKMEGGTLAKECRHSLEAEKCKERDVTLKPPEKNTALENTLTLA